MESEQICVSDDERETVNALAYAEGERDSAKSVNNAVSTAEEEPADVGSKNADDRAATAATEVSDEAAEKKTSILKSYFAKVKATLNKFKSPKFSAAYVAKMAVLTAISFLLYYLGRFVKLPFMFPSFFDMQISELPALLAGFSLGPVSGCLVIVFKCLLKLPLSSTLYVGELTDMLLGVMFVLPASLIFRLRRDKESSKSGIKHALIGLAVGSVLLTGAAMLVNVYISVPFYVQLFFHGDFDGIVGMLGALYKGITKETFYTYYLLLGVLPFNLLRCIIVSALTFLLYKRLSAILHWEGTSLQKKNAVPSIVGTHTVHSVEETYKLADSLASELDGGEIILLEGDLGAGKTTFTKGLAKSLGILEEVTSPTFSLLNVYESGRLKLNHIDLYRVENEEELAELGIADSIDGESVTVIEWNKLTGLKGKIYTVKISLGEDENSRIFEIGLEA